MSKHKILILGPANAGKTQVWRRIINKKKTYSEDYAPTAGLQTGGTGLVLYWDFASDATTVEKTEQLGTASKICLVFDASDSEWQSKMTAYLQEVVIDSNASIILVGAKVDKLNEETQVSVQAAASAYGRGKNWSNFSVQLVAAKTDFGIQALSERVSQGLPCLDSQAPANVTQRQDKRRTSLHRLAQDPDLHEFDIDALTARLEHAANDVVTPERSRDRDIGDLSAVRKQLTRFFGGEDHIPPVSTPVTRTPERNPIGGNSQTSALHPGPQAHAPQPQTTYFSLALYLAGITLMLAALTSLIYLALIASSVVSASMLMTVVNSIVVSVGGVLGIAAPLAAFSAACAGLGVSTAMGANLLVAGASVLTMALGYGLKRWSQPAAVSPEAAAGHDAVQPPQHGSYALSIALRLLGIALMLTALTNLIYLVLIATGVLNVVALTTAMNYLLVTLGGLLNITAPVVAFGNACATLGLSTAVATELLSAMGSAVLMGVGFGLFRRGTPVTEAPLLNSPEVRA